MKYIKAYENMNLPEINDYVLMKVNLVEYKWKDEVNNYINNTIGQIIDVYPNEENIRIKYDNIPDIIKSWFRIDNGVYSRVIHNDQIVAIGKSIDEVIINKNINKYNL